MYFPYFKLRKEEANAIKLTICNYNDNKVIPILEPFNKNETDLFSYKDLVNTVDHLINNNKKFVLIINNEDDLTELKNKFNNFDDYCIRGLFIDNASQSQSLNKPCAIIHNKTLQINDNQNIIYHIFMPSVLRFTSHMNLYPKNKSVKIENGFLKHYPNSTFPYVEDFNSELAFTFRSENLAGFGDFTILEEGYDVPSGGKAFDITHVIHLTKVKDDEDKIEVYHYLTTPAMEPDIRRRSIKTLEKAYNERNKFFYSKGIELIEQKYPNHTSLAFYKRIGIAHHIDLIHSIID